ncbi:hypothetical protein OK015_22055 [Mycobacterium sp. Aquia_216]|uniref:hypothetical protein n=1 Tax=Mycobacterium sp. Aquia_216 TaxID=2991729 RepID=UPI00227A2353|nr:hypothetical protein [Mycobacterium sp. Aquia_216]WAJ43834.1 hypothetical protein OK015_22055 [Mycobacterium sp. Aquia_216]
MSAGKTAEQVSLIGAELIRQTEQLGAAVASAIRDEIDFYRDTETVSQQQLVESCTDNVRFIFSGLAGPQTFDTTPAALTGESRAQSRVPLHVVMSAYRIGSHFIWQALLDIVEAHGDITQQALLTVTERIWEAQDVYTEAMTSGYRRRATQQAVADEAERAALTEALFSGTVSASHSPWEIADLLGLPTRGPYVVVAARTPELGKHALPGIVDILRSTDIYSAWRLLPELQIGIVHLPSDAARVNLLATLRRMSSHGRRRQSAIRCAGGDRDRASVRTDRGHWIKRQRAGSGVRGQRAGNCRGHRAGRQPTTGRRGSGSLGGRPR